ncbi:MAG: hypothetical protein GX958_11120 [Desulfitobacterium sp.]|nr:hypothetical protein [Desulfitobacterium sp.]
MRSEENNQNQSASNSDTVKSTVKTGISFGSCLAMIIYYTAWKSIPWAIIHGLLGWVYVFYYWAKYY